jgi:SAM-dependent methyltransferase/GT2 family glycosyltransferase
MNPAQPKLKLPDGATFTALVPELPDQPFWQVVPATGAADYADGLEELIADFNRQPAEGLAAWALAHPLTSDQRFILEYNTSADRANVLRPLPFAAGDRVIEVGCGCGPVSQYLWSRAHTVSVDASVARTRAAAQRLARQPNPHQSVLVCADFHRLAGDASFDWVIFNGVLEYAAIYSGATEASPYVAMLEKAGTFLRPGGRCVISIENRLGLKYFAGAPEDHYGRPAVGLAGYPAPGSGRPAIRTFSKPELSRLCTEAGFAGAEYLFPFPDYKFAKVIVPDDPACWKFAAERMIENSPAWRGEREHHLDEAAVFRSLAAEGLAGEFAHSFLVVTAKPSAALVPTGLSQLHYFPLQREPATAVGAKLDVARGEVQRSRMAGGALAAPVLPGAAPGNSRAGLVLPVAGADAATLVQPLSAVPTLWETLRREIGATTETAPDYQARLEQSLRAQQELYLATLPFTPEGNWRAFLDKLQAEFARAGLAAAAADALGFLEGQREFAANSLGRLKLAPWTWWAPDWTSENLFPAPDGGVRLFDVEYVDPAACLPTPALVYRQLRMLQVRTSHPALAAHWPWPARQLQLAGSTVALPLPVADWAAPALWDNLSAEEAHRHAWFWSKVAEIVEAAMTASVVAPFQRAYGTAPWLERLSTELGPLAASVATAQLVAGEISRTHPVAETDREMHDELAEKEQQIRRIAGESSQKEEEIRQLHTTAQERLEALLQLDREVKRLGTALQAAQPGGDAPWREARPAEKEVIDLQARLAETRRRLQVTQDQLTRREREIHLLKPRHRRLADLGPVDRWLERWSKQLAEKNPHPLARLQQYAPRPLRLEKFPRPPRLPEWPRICIITPSYQQAAFLPRTMQSVLDQNYPNLAYGVQDGGSTDGSAEIITGQLARLAHAESAPDKGQSDAIRRGFAKLFPASHDLMGWVNSDDLLMPGALSFIGAYFARHPEVDVVYGHRVIIDEADREVGRWFMPRHHAETLKWFDLVPQETLFWRARCYQEIGGLDESFQFALDWDLLARFEQACFTIRRLPYFLGCFRVHPEQKTSAKILSVGEQEMHRIRRRIHERAVTPSEIQQELTAEIQRSAVVERLHRFGVRY